MLELPKRDSIINRVAGVLESAILREEWRQKLPGERRLCAQLNVSRMTLERALNIIERKGLIRSQPRVGHLIRKVRPRPARQNSTTIHILLRIPCENLSDWEQLWYKKVEQILSRRGFGLQFHAMAFMKGKSLSKRLADLVKSEPAACWALASASRETQKWFLAHHIPTLVIGHCYPGIQFPSVDVDRRAICRHAVTTLLRLGHRFIILLMSRHKFAGEVYGEQGFREGFAGMAPPNARGEVWHHNLDPDSVRSMIRKKWSRKGYPTAVIVLQTHCAIAVASTLIELGMHLAKDVSLICQESDETLRWFTPPIANYMITHNVFVQRVARMLIRLAQTGAIETSALILPHLAMGGSVGPAPSSKSGR